MIKLRSEDLTCCMCQNLLVVSTIQCTAEYSRTNTLGVVPRLSLIPAVSTTSAVSSAAAISAHFTVRNTCCSRQAECRMCLVRMTRYSLCLAAHSVSSIVVQHAQAIYCGSQQVVVVGVEGRCLRCTMAENSKHVSTSVMEREAFQHTIHDSNRSSLSIGSQ